MISFLKKNKLIVIAFLLLAVLTILSPQKGIIASQNALGNFKSVGMVLPPIFVMIGLLDVWVPKEVMVKYMGRGSGIKGGLIAIFLGSVGAGPLVVAFPVAALLIRKGARLAYVFLFLGAWTSVKLPIFMFEWANLGGTFTSIHVSTSIIVYILGGFILEKLLSSENKEDILERSQKVA
tara:strand:+ start:27 stop:563 length:537 start_codon:yes stop_codon:yes gene_type:complete